MKIVDKKMKNTINKIFSNEIDEQVHSEFVKFSRGVFENRYLIEGKRQADKWSIKTGSEFANYFVRRGLEKVKGKIKIAGAIISTLDLRKYIDFEISDSKGYMGIKQLIIDSEIETGKILDLMNKQPKVFYALSFSIPDYELKIKAKAPKSGKPAGKGNDGPKADFCSLKTIDKEIIHDLFPDFPDFKEIKIKHTININDIEIPKNEKDPAKIREAAKRKGVIERIIKVDERQEIRKKDFVA